MEGNTHQPEGEGRKDAHISRMSWQDAITEYCGKQYDTPTGHAYPNGVAYFLHELQGQAEQVGDRATATQLATLNDTYGLIAFPFLSIDTQSHYRPAFAKRGWLQPQDAEEPDAIKLSDEQYRSLTQLLEKSNIPEMRRLEAWGDIPQQTTAEGAYAIAVAPLLADLRYRNAVFRHSVKMENRTEEEKAAAAKEKHLPKIGVRLVKPLSGARVIRAGFSPDSNREKR